MPEGLRHKVTKRVSICAAHSLPALPPEHQCHRVHGHNYTVEITLSAQRLDNFGMVLDYNILSQLVKKFDHQNLNDFFEPTTAENFCNVLWDTLEQAVLMQLNRGADPKGHVRIESVKIMETENNIAMLSR